MDQIDQILRTIAQDYQKHLSDAKTAFPTDPKKAGNQAQADLSRNLRARGAILIQNEPGTGVDSAGGGHSRFDVLFRLFGVDVYLEVQATDYTSGHKPVQTQGQVIGFAVAGAGSLFPARYYKIIGSPRVVYCWHWSATQAGLKKGDYRSHDAIWY